MKEEIKILKGKAIYWIVGFLILSICCVAFYLGFIVGARAEAQQLYNISLNACKFTIPTP